MTTLSPVDQLVDDAILCSAEFQVTLAGVLQRYSWTIDVAQGTITLSGASEIHAQIQALGTLGADAWWWAWDERQLPELPAAARQCARIVQSYGNEYAVADFAINPVPARADLGHQLTLAAKAITGQYLHFVCRAPTGQPVYLLLTGTGIDPPPVVTSLAATVIRQALAETEIHDHRRALSSWAHLRGFGHHESESEVVLELADGDLHIGCSADRIVSIGGVDVAPKWWMPTHSNGDGGAQGPAAPGGQAVSGAGTAPEAGPATEPESEARRSRLGRFFRHRQ